MRIVRKHNMTREAARDWVEAKLPTLMQQYSGHVSDPRHAWQGDTMEFSGHTATGNIKGELRVTDTELILYVDLPWLARLMQGVLQSGIERWFDEKMPT